jgi:uncharacterized protein YjbI with pentapeptide repeats
VANLKHVDILKQGIDVWNEWREKNTDIQRPDFIEAHLERAHLEGADLKKAHFEGANLERANLERANLTEAHLEGANLKKTHLEGARLTGANLERANLTGANLTGAILTGAILSLETKLIIDQLSTVKTLYNVVGLDSTLLKQVQKKYPHLMKER